MRILMTTCSPEAAEELLLALLRERLVACGNLIRGVRSHYLWKGEICCDEEVMIWMETAADRVEAAMRRLKDLHPYETPKIVAFEPCACDVGTRSWIRDVATGGRDALPKA